VDKSLKSLVRLNEWRVDEQRRALAERLRVLAELEEKSRRLEREIIEEQRIAAEQPAIAGFTYGRYAEAARARQAALARALTEANAMVDAGREAVRTAFREQKKVEITARTRAERRRAEIERRDRIDLDEVALVGHTRAKAPSPS
jgi:flagellar FliJ protein